MTNKKMAKKGGKLAKAKAKAKKPAAKSKKKAPFTPKGFRTITAYLTVNDGARALEFYTKAFGAKELFRMPMPGGKVGHAEMKLGDGHIMLSDECPEMGARSPQTIGGSPVCLMVYVKDVDAQVEKAVAAGAEITRPIENMFYGDRSCALRDPFGHNWFLSTHIEDVPPKELAKRAAAAHKSE